jgi:hypothetical protein
MVEIPAEFDSFRDYVDIFSHLYLWEYFSRIVSKGDRRNVEVGRREEAEVNVLKYGKQRVACWIGYLSLKYTPVTKRGGKKKQKKTVEVFLEHPNSNQIDREAADLNAGLNLGSLNPNDLLILTSQKLPIQG